MIRSRNGIEMLVNLINIGYCAMKLLPYKEETFSKYRNVSVQEFRIANVLKHLCWKLWNTSENEWVIIRSVYWQTRWKRKNDKKQEYQDNTDRIEIERTFSLSKRCYGMECITTKLEETLLTSIALSLFVTNLFKIQKRILYALLYLFQSKGSYEDRNLQISA